MRPGNRNLFWLKISQSLISSAPKYDVSKNGRLHIRLKPSEMCGKNDAWSPYETYNRSSKWYITCTSQEMVVKCRKDRTTDGGIKNQTERKAEFSAAKIFVWARTWHSKWHEDLLSCVGVNDGLCAQSVTSSPWCQEATGCRCNFDPRQRYRSQPLTCLIFWAFHSCTGRETLLVTYFKWPQFSPSPAGTHLMVWDSGWELPIFVIIQQLDARFQLCL